MGFTWGPEGEVTILVVAFWSLPTGYEMVDWLGISKRILRIVEGVIEHL